MRYYFSLVVIFSLLTGCGNEINKKVSGEKNYSQQISDQKVFEIPKTLKKKTDIFLDSVFISIPSEGTVIKKYNTNDDGFLYTASSFGTMNSIYQEILTKKDSIIVTKKIEEYNKPLTTKNAKLINKKWEYFIFVADTLSLYAKNDTLRQKTQEQRNKLNTIKKILEKINKKGN